MLGKIKDILKIVLFLLFISIFMVFVFTNTEKVKVNLFPFSIEIRLFLLVVFTFIFGFLFALFLNFIKNLFNRDKAKENKKIADMEKEIKILKSKYGDLDEEIKKD